MKIGIIIPTRGDRPTFLNFCLKRISEQTIKPDHIIIVDDKPLNNLKDITWRYKLGIKRATELGCSVAFFWEDDDWYSKDYLEWMLSKWKENGSPSIFGINETYYYHIKIGKHLWMDHQGRASAFCTLIKLPLESNFNWPADSFPFLDMKIWQQIKGKAIRFGKDVKAIGIKHGIGLTGGGGHNINFKWSNHDAKKWFKDIVKEDFNFYETVK